jgi:hypothetical protein
MCPWCTDWHNHLPGDRGAIAECVRCSNQYLIGNSAIIVTPSGAIDLSGFVYLSNNHVRYQHGSPTPPNPGCRRAVVITGNALTGEYDACILNLSQPHPIWHDNYQLIPKHMAITSNTSSEILLRGVGSDDVGQNCENYGFKILFTGGFAQTVVAYMYDKDVEIQYYKEDVIHKGIPRVSNGIPWFPQ